MSIIADRVVASIDRNGQSVTFSTSGAKVCVVVMLDSGTMNSMLDDVEIMGVVHPGVKILLKGADSVAVDETFTWDSRLYTVLKVFLNYVGSYVVSRTAIAS